MLNYFWSFRHHLSKFYRRHQSSKQAAIPTLQPLLFPDVLVNDSEVVLELKLSLTSLHQMYAWPVWQNRFGTAKNFDSKNFLLKQLNRSCLLVLSLNHCRNTATDNCRRTNAFLLFSFQTFEISIVFSSFFFLNIY